MKDVKRREVAHAVWKKPARAYASALLAVGLAAGVTISGVGRSAWGADDAQALDPVNVGGGKSAVPAAVEPESVPKSAEKVPESAGKVPENTGTNTQTPTVTTPPAPTTPATPAAETPAVVAPALSATPPTPETAPAPAAVAAPTTPAATENAATTAPAAAEVAATTEAATTAPAVAASGPATLPGIESTAVPIASDGPLYPCTGIVLKYHEDHAGEPPIAQLMETPIKLGVVNDGYVTTRPGVPVTAIKLKDIGKGMPQAVHQNGLNAIYLQLVDELNRRGIVGVFVVVDETDVIDQGAQLPPKDVRELGQTQLHLTIVTSTVKRVRTLATGEGVKEGDRVDNPRYQWIKDRSPLQGGERADLLNKDVLDDYVLRLNRMPGRHVDVAVSGTGITKEDAGKVNLDYLVSENRPWYVYAQVSNTGTAQTNDWRERFGFVDNQLTGHDDILSLDYITAGFDTSQDVIASYELPVPGWDNARNKLYGSWNEFTASDVGQSKEKFSGEEWIAGDEVAWNFFQHRELFIDGVGVPRGRDHDRQHFDEAAERGRDVLLAVRWIPAGPVNGAGIDDWEASWRWGT